MSKIFELFGYRLDSWNAKAAHNLSQANCPFMNMECDGGGNRYLSEIDLTKYPTLAACFPGRDHVQCGVCSLSLKDDEQPWIVCPRRLLSLRGTSKVDYQADVKKALLKYGGIRKGQSVRAWAEVKMKVETTTEDEHSKSFDYSFDYVLAGSIKKPLAEIADVIGESFEATKKIAFANDYTVAYRNGEFWVDDFPSDPILIVEVMTSSTSGGDKKKRTQISMAFEDAVVNPDLHKGPGINYRQVWARMVSQLIVKSQVAIAWKGRTIWLLQDVLADYISNSTALNLSRFIAANANEVNILSFGYGDFRESKKALIRLQDHSFYSGPIDRTKNSGTKSHGFVDIVKIGAPPPKEYLWRSLFKKKACGILSAK